MFTLRNGGFTLMEILVAMVVLSVGFLAVAAYTAGVARSNAFSKRLTTAIALAQEKMEEMRAEGYGPLSTGPGKTTEDFGGIPSHGPFKRVAQTVHVSTAEDRILLVTVTVVWDDGSHGVTLQTILGA